MAGLPPAVAAPLSASQPASGACARRQPKPHRGKRSACQTL